MPRLELKARRRSAGTLRPLRVLFAITMLAAAGCSTSAPTSPSDNGDHASNTAPAPTSPTPTPTATPEPAVAPTITTQPLSQTQDAGHTALLTVQVAGTEPIAFQWYLGPSGDTSSPVSGATSASLTTPLLMTTTSYWVRASNAAGSVDSHTATITVVTPSASPSPAPSPTPSPTPSPSPSPTPTPTPPSGTAPVIVSQPAGQTIASGQSVTLAVVATGSAPLAYQWYAGSSGNVTSPIGGASSSSFTTPALSVTTSYWVRVSNSAGSADSATATIAVSATSGNTSFEDQVLILVNQQRAAGATCGGVPYPAVPALTMNGSLRTAAQGHSFDMATQDYFSHTSLDGRTFDQRIHDAGYVGSTLGENIAAGQTTPAAVVSAWMGSTGHCTNIMHAGYTAAGVGYAYNVSSTYRHYWTLDFGG